MSVDSSQRTTVDGPCRVRNCDIVNSPQVFSREVCMPQKRHGFRDGCCDFDLTHGCLHMYVHVVLILSTLKGHIHSILNLRGRLSESQCFLLGLHVSSKAFIPIPTTHEKSLASTAGVTFSATLTKPNLRHPKNLRGIIETRRSTTTHESTPTSNLVREKQIRSRKEVFL